MSAAAMHVVPAGQSAFIERAARFVEGRERVLSMGVGVLAGAAFLVATAAVSAANGCVAPTVVAAFEVSTLV